MTKYYFNLASATFILLP